MIPTNRLIVLALAWAVAGAFARSGAPWWWLWPGVALAGLMAIDALWVVLETKPVVRRRLPGRLALGEAGEVTLVLANSSRRKLRIEMFDGIPEGASAPAMPWKGELPPGREVRVAHPVTSRVRGEAVFRPVHLRFASPLGLWQRQIRQLGRETVRVYPNYEPVVRFALLAMQHRESPLGIVRRTRAGTSRDFHQLRDYRDGDAFSQIDWKASSRRQVLISRDFQEQRNQSIVFMLDTGRRMRTIDGDLPQFDHALNALLLVAYVALRQGDQVGVKSFGGTNRWLPPLKGSHAMPVLLNHLYDYQTTPAPSDFTAAVQELMARQRRRSLVILLTNLRGEDGKELVPALSVLQSRHLVLLASLRERTVDDALHVPVDGVPAALRFLAADRYAGERREILAALEAAGVLTLDTTAQQLAVALANRYLDIKAAGRI